MHAALRAEASRPVSVPLALGIAFLPLIFVWYTLEPGRSRRSRVLAFGWLTAIAAVNVLSRSLGLVDR